MTTGWHAALTWQHGQLLCGAPLLSQQADVQAREVGLVVGLVQGQALPEDAVGHAPAGSPQTSPWATMHAQSGDARRMAAPAAVPCAAERGCCCARRACCPLQGSQSLLLRRGRGAQLHSPIRQDENIRVGGSWAAPALPAAAAAPRPGGADHTVPCRARPTAAGGGAGARLLGHGFHHLQQVVEPAPGGQPRRQGRHADRVGGAGACPCRGSMHCVAQATIAWPVQWLLASDAHGCRGVHPDAAAGRSVGAGGVAAAWAGCTHP